MPQQGNEKERGNIRTVADTALDIAIGGSALAADKAKEAVDKAVERAEEITRTGSQTTREKVADVAEAARRAVSDGDGRAYEDRTRDELYELAKEREISGRSSMAKAELIEALREQR